jgi:hypothetical protein
MEETHVLAAAAIERALSTVAVVGLSVERRVPTGLLVPASAPMPAPTFVRSSIVRCRPAEPGPRASPRRARRRPRPATRFWSRARGLASLVRVRPAGCQRGCARLHQGKATVTRCGGGLYRVVDKLLTSSFALVSDRWLTQPCRDWRTVIISLLLCYLPRLAECDHFDISL